MLHVPVFWALLVAVTGLGLLFGGGPERWTAGMFLAAAIATRLSLQPVAIRFQEIEISAFAIDLALLLGLLVITVASDRFCRYAWSRYIP